MKTINPQSKPKARNTANVMRDKMIALAVIQAEQMKSAPRTQSTHHARRLLSTVKGLVPPVLDQQKRHDLVQYLRESEYVGGGYDEPYITDTIEGDMVYINGRFSLRQLAKRFQW